jgi:myosin heavy chain 9/10/11/14
MAHNAAQKRNNPFARTTSPSPSPNNVGGRPKSAVFTSPLSVPQNPSHNRHQSSSSIPNAMTPGGDATSRHQSSSKTGTPTSNTFAPSFIQTAEMKRNPEKLNGIEGENDFSGKRYVWLKDPTIAFVKGWIVEELGGNQILVQCDDGSVRHQHPVEEASLTMVLTAT